MTILNWFSVCAPMLATSAVASLPKLPPVRRGRHCIEENVVPTSKFPRGLLTVDNSRSLGRRTRSTQAATIICAAALNARCGAEQTQTVTREAPTITHIPGKEKSPQIDDGGSGFPPRDDDGDGGGGGGGGNWSGGFFFFGFLAFLGFMKDRESEDEGYGYRDNRRRR
uniref:Protein YELLOW LEAF 1, choloroplastic-like isoform X2 n=1 Tax=Cicer arietinum TaxID=3827 RepID=A0A3Q7XQT1_CICAR|nr:protein YELLOW LEAF 1, choloroplastic-like isoform X2 [Cicer arietinum]